VSEIPETPDSVHTEAEATPKHRFRMGCLGYCACIFLLCIVLWGGAKLWMVHALNTELDALRAAGEPVTWQEVIDSIEPLPDEENSTLVLQPHLLSFEQWEDKPVSRAVLSRMDVALGVRRSDEMTKLMRVCLADGRAALDVLHDAAGCPSGRWPLGPHPLIYGHRIDEHLWQLERARRLLDVELEQRAADGDGHGAALSLRAMRRLAASLDGSPYLPAVLRRLGADALGGVAAERALSLTELPAADLAMLRDEFAIEAEELSLRAAIRGERASLLWLATEQPQMLGDYLNVPKVVFALRRVTPGMLETDALFGLKCTTEGLGLLDLPPRESLVVGKLHDTKYSGTRAGWRNVVLHPASAIVKSAHGRAGVVLVRVKLRLHIVRAALAVEQFRMERGHWPVKLADLVPDYIDAVPQDWFAPVGTTVRYVRTPSGARVWSRGDDNPLGLTKQDEYLNDVAQNILGFFQTEGRLPKTLDELMGKGGDSVPTDPRTGKPLTYVTKPANPALFILGGRTGGVSEAEFWKQRLTTDEWAERHRAPQFPVVFRLLDPKLRGAGQSRFTEEISIVRKAMYLHQLGYTRERLKALGFSDSDVNDYEAEVKSYLAGGWEPVTTIPTGIHDPPPDTQAGAAP
jgi:hypothetical protein